MRFNLFRKAADGNRHPAAPMTWAKSSVGRTVSRTGVFLKKQIWIWPIIAVLVLSIIGPAQMRANSSSIACRPFTRLPEVGLRYSASGPQRAAKALASDEVAQVPVSG